MKVAMLAISLLLAGCGFHLQGRRVMPPALATVHLEAIDEQSDFTRALRESLKASGVRLVAKDSAGTTVRIRRDELTERVLSVDARNNPTDKELTYKVEVEVRSGGQELMPVEPFELYKSFSYDVRKQLAKEGEKDIVREDLARDMASVVTRRLSML